MPHCQLISGEVRALPGTRASVPSWRGAAREAPGASVRLAVPREECPAAAHAERQGAQA